MIVSRILFVAVTFMLFAGCGTPKHIKRDRDLSNSAVFSKEIGLNAYESSETFDGRLNLLYEKKIKGSADSPIITAKRMVAFKSTRQRFLGFDQITGKKTLQVKKRRGYILNPVIHDSLLILVQRSRLGRIQVRNLFTGKVMAERTINEIRSGPIIVSNSLIFGTVDGLLTLKLPKLENGWRIRDNEIISVPAVSDSTVLFYAVGENLKAVKAADGARIWATACGSAIVSELSLGNYLYASLADGRMMAVEKESGQIIWERMFAFPVHGSVAEYEGRMYFGGTDGKIYCLSSIDGAILWGYQTEGIVTASPIVYGRAVLVGSHDRHFYSVDRISGQLIDRHRTEGPVTLAAAVDNEHIFIACRKNRLYCFKGS